MPPMLAVASSSIDASLSRRAERGSEFRYVSHLKFEYARTKTLLISVYLRSLAVPFWLRPAAALRYPCNPWLLT